MTQSVFLRGYGFSGYRSFAAGAPQRIGPLSKVHLLAGPNNSGKSNALAIARDALPALRENQSFQPSGTDVPAGAPSGEAREFHLSVGTPWSDETRNRVLEKVEDGVRSRLVEALEKADRLVDGVLWFDYFRPQGRAARHPGGWVLAAGQAEALVAGGDTPLDKHALSRAADTLTRKTSNQPVGNAAGLLDYLADALQVKPSIPQVMSIGAFRQIGVGSADTGDYHAGDLIMELAKLQSPTIERLEDKRRFRAINRFVQTLFDDRSAQIDVPHDRNSISVFHNDLWLPLENYGTGLHQVVILAVAATVHERHLLCIEEPEINLHPTLQRKLLRYLDEETDNQYLIATHSAHLLDAERASISAVRRHERATRMSSVIEPTQVAALSAELGYRASDLIQANMVVWVEGPSDRVYLNHWIGLLAPGLVEGVDYSIVHYGGSLLPYLSPDDPAVEQFVSLPRINRNFYLVMDSDRQKARQRISSTKAKLRRSVEDAGATAGVWITQGYTIENYVPAPLLRRALNAVHPAATCIWSGSRYVNPLGKHAIKGRKGAVDKTAIARRVVAEWPSREWPLDLRQAVRALVSRIERANSETQV